MNKKKRLQTPKLLIYVAAFLVSNSWLSSAQPISLDQPPVQKDNTAAAAVAANATSNPQGTVVVLAANTAGSNATSTPAPGTAPAVSSDANPGGTADGRDTAVSDKKAVPQHLIEFNGGYESNFRPGGKSRGYYRLVLLGDRLADVGTAVTPAKHLDLAEHIASLATGTRNSLFLRYEKQTTTLGGNLLEALGANPINLRGFEQLGLLGTLYLARDSKTGNVQLAVGLETTPRRLLPGNQSWSNWYVLGVDAQRQEATDASAGDKNFGLLIGKAFVGRDFGRKPYPEIAAELAKHFAENVLKKAPTYDQGFDLESKRAKDKEYAFEKSAQENAVLADAVSELTPDPAKPPKGQIRDEQWRAIVTAVGRGYAEALSERPTALLYGEFSGWLTVAGSRTGGRARGLISANLDYFFMPKRDNVFLRLRYENGYERATPQDRKDRFLVSVGFQY